MTVTHDLKSWPEFFRDVADGYKTFEVRFNDRDFQVGDVLRLREWDPMAKAYTGRVVTRSIVYVADLSRIVMGSFVGLGLAPGSVAQTE